ncbi:ERVV1 protein, partial [Mesembrinibis cayennensis]|nr:ERVV1 protein [Mesembrinibis cayennensis]
TELEKDIVNVSAEVKMVLNATADALTALQTELKSISQIVNQNRLALDYILAAQGGVMF